MRIGFFAPAVPGHTNPMATLARAVQARGHHPVYFARPEIVARIEAAGLDVCPFSTEYFKPGQFAEQLQTMARLEGAAANHYAAEIMAESCRKVIADGPRVIRESRVEGLVLDAVTRDLDLVAMHMGVPYVHVNCGLHVDYTGRTPPYFFDWPYEAGPAARARNLAGLHAAAQIRAPFLRVVQEYVQQVGLPLDLNKPYATFSKRAQLTQTPKEFDFPSDHWPPYFHYTGPFHEKAFRPPVPFPWERLTGEPLIYASMGTMLNGAREVFQTILEAASAPGRQLVLSIGANLTPEAVGPAPGNTIVVNQAPQLDILQRAALCITHAGLNTVLEALSQGVPLVAIPVAYDHPGIAARIRYSQTGLHTPLRQLTVEGLREQVNQVLHDPLYGERAQRLQRIIQERNGLQLAAGIAEEALAANK